MSSAERKMWRINIENAVGAVCEICGSDVAKSIFRRYDATNFEDLSSSYYAEVFGDLELVANDY